MTRIARKYSRSHYMHIIIQGIDRQYIFKNDEMKKAYMHILQRNIADTNIKILAYCMMDNHIHFILYGEDSTAVSKFMHKNNTRFAKLYNKQNHRVGYVFRDRYYMQEILSKKQLFNCLAYIHYNPVKAGMVKHEREYEFSSYKDYMGMRQSRLITSDSIKLIFASDDYRKAFDEIHRNKEMKDIFDVEDYHKENMTIIQTFAHSKGKKLQEIKEDKQLFSELILRLKENKMSLRDMEKMFGVSRYVLSKMIK